MTNESSHGPRPKLVYLRSIEDWPKWSLQLIGEAIRTDALEVLLGLNYPESIPTGRTVNLQLPPRTQTIQITESQTNRRRGSRPSSRAPATPIGQASAETLVFTGPPLPESITSIAAVREEILESRVTNTIPWTTWKSSNMKLLSYMRESSSAYVLDTIKTATTAYYAFVAAGKLFQESGPAYIGQKTMELFNISYKDCKNNPLDFVLQFNSKIENLRQLGASQPEGIYPYIFLHALPEQFSTFASSIRLSPLGRTNDMIQEIFEQFKNEAARQKGDEQLEKQRTVALMASNHNRKRKGDSNIDESNENQKRSKKCDHCKKKGHDKDSCWKKHPELIPKKFKKTNKKQEKKLSDAKEEDSVDSNTRFGMAAIAISKPESVALFARTNPSIWLLDQGANEHICANRNLFRKFRHLSGTKISAVGGNACPLGIGTISIILYTVDNTPYTLVLTDVLYIPTSPGNLLSMSRLELENNLYYDGKDRKVRSIINDEEAFEAIMQNGVYIAKQDHAKPSSQALLALHSEAPSKSAVKDLWHARLGHIGVSKLHRMSKRKLGVPYIRNDTHLLSCGSCKLANLHRKQSHRPVPLTRRLGELVHIDPIGPISPPGIHGERYAVPITEDASRVRWVKCHVHKNSAFDQFVNFEAFFTTQTGLKILRLRRDNGSEHGIRKLDAFMLSKGISDEPSPRYCPEQNGVAEAANNLIISRARAMLIAAQLPALLWPYAIQTAVYILNRLPTKALPDEEVPFARFINLLEDRTGEKKILNDDLKHLRIWGCNTWAYIPKEIRQQGAKMEPRAVEGRLIGYGRSKNSYYIWLGDDKVVLSSNVVFDEKCFTFIQRIDWSKGGPEGELQVADENEVLDSITITQAPEEPDTQQVELGMGGIDTISFPPYTARVQQKGGAQDESEDRMSVLKPLVGFSQDGNNSMPSIARSGPEKSSQDGNKIIPSVARSGPGQEEKALNQQANQSPRSTPTDDPILEGSSQDIASIMALAAVGIGDPIQNMEDAEEPQSYSEACSSAYSTQWKEAMDAEINALVSNQTWEDVDSRLAAGRELAGKWVYKIKRGQNGKILRFKARWVAKGFAQISGIDYMETYASVVRSTSIRILMALACHYDWELDHMDVVTAFLNPPIDTELYIQFPTGYKVDGRTCRLKKTLYGLKQSPRQWGEMLANYLISIGFTRSNADPSIFIRGTNNALIIICIYVDDLLLMGPSRPIINEVKKKLSTEYKMVDLGPCKYYLGLEVIRNREARELSLLQTGYLKKLLKAVGMADSKGVRTPMLPGTILDPLQQNPDLDPDFLRKYQSDLGSIMYGMTHTRPDLGLSMSILSRYLSSPTPIHAQALKKVLRYIRQHPTSGLHFGRSYASPLEGYVDSDYATDKDTRRSTTGWIYLLFGTPVAWKSQRQAAVTLSSCEAEYIAAVDAAKEGIWILQLLKDLGAPDDLRKSITLNCDNTSTINLAEGTAKHGRTKHIDVRHHWLKEKVADGTISIKYVKSEDNLADGLTKPYSAARQEQLLEKWGLD